MIKKPLRLAAIGAIINLVTLLCMIGFTLHLNKYRSLDFYPADSNYESLMQKVEALDDADQLRKISGLQFRMEMDTAHTMCAYMNCLMNISMWFDFLLLLNLAYGVSLIRSLAKERLNDGDPRV